MQYLTKKYNLSYMRNLAKQKLVFSMASCESRSVLRMKLFLRCQVSEKGICLRHLLHANVLDCPNSVF